MDSFSYKGIYRSIFLAAALSRNSEQSRIYVRAVLRSWCPICCIIDRSLVPTVAAEVTKPARRLWQMGTSREGNRC